MNGADPGSSSSATPDTNTNTGGGVVDGEGDTTEGTPGSNEQQDSNVVGPAGGSTGGVPLLSPKSVYSNDGKVAEVDAAVPTAVDNFSVPAGFVRKGSRVDSFMYSLGVYVEKSGSTNHTYFCLASSKCRSNKKIIPCPKGDRSNVNTHLKRQHKMQGTEGVKKRNTKKETQTSIQSALAASTNSGLGKNRCASRSPPTHRTRRFLASASKHLLVEMYVATKKAVVGNMLTEIERAPLPIVHYGIDLWQCKITGLKYIDVHVCYVNSNLELQHELLAVKHYAPSAAVQATGKASEILFNVFNSVLREFGVKISDLAGGTTDSGSDVKAMCVNFLLAQHKGSWDWCVCHLADRAAEQAFGTSADPQKPKNKDARGVVQLVIKAAAKVNQSPIFKQKFDEAQLQMTGEVLKIRKHAPQRWLSLVRVMERIIRLWHVLRKVYANDGVEFPLDKGDNKDNILQLYSLLRPLAAITRDGQYGAVPMSAEMHMAFAELKQEGLDPTGPLKVFDIPPTPDSPAALQSDEELPVTVNTGKKPLPHKTVEPAALRPVATKTRELLGKALVEKLYARLWDEESADPSPFRNASVLLTPSYKDSKFLDGHALTAGDAQHLGEGRAHLAPTLDDDVQSKLDASWADIRKRASDAARKEHSKAATGQDGQPPLKRFCSPSGAPKPRFASLARHRARHESADGSDGDSEINVLMQQMSQEIERYHSLYITAEEVARLSRTWHIPGFKDIPMIAARDIHTCLPPRFNGGDADLTAAEAAFDVIKNTETGDVGL
ncbi:unnamed protein product [Ectocarpus sp. CCAP 1310/34]|nr:unnamed protein product [Ectocarpus sp. CCAP 1310/34]